MRCSRGQRPLRGERVTLRGLRDTDVDDRLRHPIDPEEEHGYGSAWRRKYCASCCFSIGAGDGNRTHTVSLGIGQIVADEAVEQPSLETRR